MDARARELKEKWRAEQRAAALAELPLPIAELDAMFGMLEVELDRAACDRTRRLTDAWLSSRGADLAGVGVWLEAHGGYCDCEVLANVEGRVELASPRCHGPTDAADAA